MNEEKVKGIIKELLVEIGEDPEREGLIKTPERVMKALQFLTKGYNENPEEAINEAVFQSQVNNMIIVRDIEIYSLCEHHMLPFFGRCHIGYIPNDKVMGVSKLCRIVEVFAKTSADPGKIDFTDSQRDHDSRQCPRCGCCHGMPAFVHDDARRGKTEFHHDNIFCSGMLYE